MASFVFLWKSIGYRKRLTSYWNISCFANIQCRNWASLLVSLANIFQRKAILKKCGFGAHIAPLIYHDCSQERYEHAIELFLTRYPNEEVRHHPCRPGGHQYPQKRKRKKYVPDKFLPAVINEILSSDEELALSDISSDEWCDSSIDWYILLVYLIIIYRLCFMYKFIFCPCYALKDITALFWFEDFFLYHSKRNLTWSLPAIMKNLLLALSLNSCTEVQTWKCTLQIILSV